MNSPKNCSTPSRASCSDSQQYIGTWKIGRIAGPSWIILGLLGYLLYRRRKRLPVFRSQPHDWRKAQINILQSAGELEMMDEYLVNVRLMDERRQPRSFGPP